MQKARERLSSIAIDYYSRFLRKKPTKEYIKTIDFILSKNIIQGDSLNGIDKILFTQWTLMGYRFKREEYMYSSLELSDRSLLLDNHVLNESKEPIYIPTPIKSYEFVHYKRLLEEIE